MKFKKGFTLLELIVVIAIIGILVVAISAFLGSARNQGKDSAIQSEMKSLVNQINIVVGGGSYATVFDGASWSSSDPKIQQLLTSINRYSSVHTANADVNAWAVQVQLTSDTSKYFCVDTSGKGTTSETALGTATVCP
jgi:prepilin-type N-terminal cleavage/methylation domain-containing protein